MTVNELRINVWSSEVCSSDLPMMLNLKDLIKYFVEHRHEVVVRRTQYELAEAEKRAHILEGYLVALDNLDEIIRLIRESVNPEAAREGLIQQDRKSTRLNSSH